MREVIKTDVIKDNDENVELEFELGDESEITIRFEGKELAIADWSNIREVFMRALEIWPKEAEQA
jgi:hypothetical protein